MTSGEEIEIKFLLAHPDRIPELVTTCGGRETSARVHEFNIRFDNTAGELQTAGRVLRLRRDTRCRLTFKDRSQHTGGVVRRREIEVEVGSFESAKSLVEALGFQVVFAYEKYRTTYELLNTEVVLDELPFGHFLEIEGEEKNLRQASTALRLHWETGIPLSYHALFERLRETRELRAANLTFEELGAAQIGPTDLGVLLADD